MKEKLVLFMICAVLLVGFAAGLLVNEQRVASTIEAERQSNYAFMGAAAAEAEARATRWYRTLFLDTHITQFTFDLAATNRKDSGTDNKTVDAVAGKGVLWWQARMRVLWSIAFEFLVRLSNILVWLPLAVLVFVPFIVDAIVLRKIKATNFAITSPHLQIFGVRAMTVIVVGFFLLQLLPMMLHPVWTPLAIAAFSTSLWIGISQFAKRA